MIRRLSCLLALATAVACGGVRSPLTVYDGGRADAGDAGDGAKAMDARDAADASGARGGTGAVGGGAVGGAAGAVGGGAMSMGGASGTTDAGAVDEATPDSAADLGVDAAADLAADAGVDSGADAPGEVLPGSPDVSVDLSGRDTAPETGTWVDASVPDVGAPVPTFRAWPGEEYVETVDEAKFFGADLSGIVYQPGTSAVNDNLWAVDNGTSTLYWLRQVGGLFQPLDLNGWKAGKVLQYPNGSGGPDAEGLTMAAWQDPAIYVVAERNNEAKSTSRMSVLRYDTSASGTTLVATNEWNLTPDLPASDPNKGPEGLAWLPDSFLVAAGFLDESTGKAYVPRDDDGHGTGLFFVGLESNGTIYAYALNHTNGTFHRIATIASGQSAVIDLTFDRDLGTLWSYCDDTCDNRATLLDIDREPTSRTYGRFVVRAAFQRPGGLPNAGNEGISLGPVSECQQGKRAFYWSDDSDTDDHALRVGTVPCTKLY